MENKLTNSQIVQAINENPSNAYYLLIRTSELSTMFQELYCFFMNVAANQGEIYTTKLNDEMTRAALIQMTMSGTFSK